MLYIFKLREVITQLTRCQYGSQDAIRSTRSFVDSLWEENAHVWTPRICVFCEFSQIKRLQLFLQIHFVLKRGVGGGVKYANENPVFARTQNST